MANYGLNSSWYQSGANAGINSNLLNRYSTQLTNSGGNWSDRFSGLSNKLGTGAKNFLFGAEQPLSATAVQNYLVSQGMTPSGNYATDLQTAMNNGLQSPTSREGGLFSLEGATAAANLIGAGTGVGNLVLAYKQYEQGKKQFDVERGLLNRNLSNQAKQINNQIAASANIAAQLNRKAGMSGADYRAAKADIEERAKRTYVDGSPV